MYSILSLGNKLAFLSNYIRKNFIIETGRALKMAIESICIYIIINAHKIYNLSIYIVFYILVCMGHLRIH